ncbi:MAG: hypothetical protein HYV33_05605 [Candidatus Kerfeldbacteria bacterium]|nr:hypothetical protein [Candidatus Kerfeldbacteria bacterium]
MEQEPIQEVWGYQRLKTGIIDAFENNQSGLTAYEHLPRQLSLGDHTVPGSFAGMIHSHSNGLTFSPFDIANLLTIPDLKFSLVSFSDRAAALVTTADTQWLPITNREHQAERWTSQIDQRLDRFHTNDAAVNLVNTQQAILAMVKTLASRYRLGYYEGSLTSDSLQRVA